MTTVIVNDRNKVTVAAPGPQGPQGAAGSGGGSISDGDKGDITVSASGATWTIDANAVTTSKLQTIGAQKLLGRSGATTGDVEQVGLSADLEIDGSKNLALVNALAQQSITLTAGTGLSGGGDLSTNRSFAVTYGTTASTACEGNDSRLSDARTPTSHNHAATEITSGKLAIDRIPTGTTASSVCIGNDSRLSDARTPTSHTHALSDLTQSSATTGQVPTWNGSSWAAATPSAGGSTTTTELEFFDHFAGLTNWAMYNNSGGSAGVTAGGIATGEFGVVYVQTSANGTANARTALLNIGNPIALSGDVGTRFEMTTRLKMSGSFDASTNTGFFQFGFIDDQGTSESTDGCYFRTKDGSNWYAVTRAGGTETATDTGVAVNTSHKRFRVDVRTISTVRTVRFYIDGALEATHTTNVPTGSQRFGYGYHIVRTGTATTNTAAYLDWFRFYIEYDSTLDFS